MRAAFVMEQQVGHATFYRNLRRFIDADARILPSWVEVSYADDSSRWHRAPWLPRGIRGSLIGREQARRGLAQVPHDVAFFNTQVPAALSGGLARRRPYVLCTDITPRQYDQLSQHYGHQPDSGSCLAHIKHRINRDLFRQAVRVLAWSNWTRESLISDYGMNPDHIEVLPPGVDLEIWRPGPKRSHGPLRILFVGGDLARKGGQDLVEVYRSMPPDMAELVLVTRTSLLDSGEIRVLGNLEPNSLELIALGRSCDVFVLPSYAEAFGIAAVEACALGLPIIASNVGGLPDIVADGENGFVISPGDRAALDKYLRLLADDGELRLKLGQAARRRAELRFDARQNAKRVVDILLATTAEAEVRSVFACGQP